MPDPTRLTTPFDRETTAAEVLSGVDLTGERAVVTGGASGIGIETARSLARGRRGDTRRTQHGRPQGRRGDHRLHR
ncbi:hypothetical protein [Streptomyces sp. AcE210]|uniref:hypothetical protein n=1 Tax=Streptomyces sp. AcE210 TaxID=2292703 RepID=UPI000E302442|nr:hypothetical protein DXZ75_09520 [Streptomyces sp. AcE210]